jgi:acyl-coenzyme A synthetase/AMP-(fatty) acid ligase
LPKKPAPGWIVKVVDPENKLVMAGEIGALVVKPPLPPGTLQPCGTTMTPILIEEAWESIGYATLSL